MAQVTHALLRITAGLLFLMHGGQKLLGWFGGVPGGGPLPPLIATAGVLELVGGTLVLFGLLTRPVAFVLAGEMAVAYFMVHLPRGPVPIVNQGESAVLFCFLFLYFAGNGAGIWSIDAVRARHRHRVAVPARA